MTEREYWRECVSEAAGECGLTITDEQVAHMADRVSGGHETYGMAFPGPEVQGPSRLSEADILRQELEKEKAKVMCMTCMGRGRITSYFGTFQSTSECHRCSGEGKVSR